MTENEAIERLQCMRLFMEIEDNRNESKFLEDDYVANKMAIQALEKQIPKKTIRKPNTDMTYEEVTCPSCGRYVLKYRNEYYCECGQKLDWD